MKKIIATLLVATLLLTGCGKKVELDLNKIKEDLQNLKSDKFSYESAIGIINNNYEEYEDIYDTDVLGIGYENSEKIFYNKDEKTGNEIVIIKPILEFTDEVKTKMEEYFKESKNLTKDELEGYLIYINAQDSKKMLKEIKEAKAEIFSMLVEINKADMESMMNIKESWVDEALITSPALIVNANLYMIVKPNKGNENDVKKALDEYMVKKEEEWKLYLPDQYELFKNRKYEKYGDYLIYIVSTDNSKVLDTIKETNK